MPASDVHVALYLLSLIGVSNSYSPIKTASAAIHAYHQVTNRPSPTDSKIVKAVREAARRLLPEGKNRKEPLAWSHVTSIAQRIDAETCSLSELMVAACGQFGFHRFPAVQRPGQCVCGLADVQ